MFSLALALPIMHSIHLKDWENEILENYPPTTKPHKYMKTTTSVDEHIAQSMDKELSYDIQQQTLDDLSFDFEDDKAMDVVKEWVKPTDPPVTKKTQRPRPRFRNVTILTR